MLVVVSAVIILVVIGAMSAHCLARYRFRGGRAVRFLLLSGMMLPPQMLILSLFQMMFQYGLYNSLAGLTIVYVATQLPMTIYILEGFFAQIPKTCLTPPAWMATPTSRPSGASPCPSDCRLR